MSDTPRTDAEKDLAEANADCERMIAELQDKDDKIADLEHHRNMLKLKLLTAEMNYRHASDERNQHRALLVEIGHEVLGCDGVPCRVEALAWGVAEIKSIIDMYRDGADAHRDRADLAETELAEYQRTEPLKIAERNQLRSELAVMREQRQADALDGQAALDEANNAVTSLRPELTHARALLRDLLDSGPSKTGYGMEWELACADAEQVAMSSDEREANASGHGEPEARG
jgi:DNA repair exonuclease SbcCD ATPase subunit